MKPFLELAKPPPEWSFRSFYVQKRVIDCPYHYHQEIEITYIEKGVGQRLLGDNLGDFAPGDLCMIGSRLPHTYFHRPGFDNGPRGVRVAFIQFHADMGGGFLQKTPELNRIQSLLNHSQGGLRFGEKTVREVAPRMKKLPQLAGVARFFLFLEILNRLACDEYPEALATTAFRPRLGDAESDRAQRVFDWIAAHYMRPLRLKEAADQLHMTAPSFCRYFRRITNRPFTRFVNDIRVGHAARMLVETGMSVSEIAFKSGFENLSNFNRRFKERHGITPVEFRNTGKIVSPPAPE
jgi:AraC-like DNA-binding protein